MARGSGGVRHARVTVCLDVSRVFVRGDRLEERAIDLPWIEHLQVRIAVHEWTNWLYARALTHCEVAWMLMVQPV